MTDMIYKNENGRKVVITHYKCKACEEFIVNLDYYNHKVYNTLKGAQKYLERNGYTICE